MAPSNAMWTRRARAAVAGLVVSALVLGAAELVTRLLTGPPTVPLVAELPWGAKEWFTEADGALTPTWQARDVIDPVPLTPTPGVPRVLWLGGSSVHSGNPDVPLEGEAAGLVATMLGIEVVNLGGPGLDSGLIAAMVPDALRLKPDLVVIYVGHNDLGNAVFTNRYGDARSVWIARMRGVLGFSRIFELLEANVRAREVMRAPSPGNEGSFRVDAARRAVIHARHEEHMRRIASLVRDAGSQFLILTQISNPLAPYLEPSCPNEYGSLGLRTNQRPEAIAVDTVDPRMLDDARARAPKCPELRWIAARQAADRGDAGALEELDLLRDEDPLPLRADRTMIGIQRDVARSEGALLGDVTEAVRAQGGGIEPAAYFIDFVHPTADGQRAIAAVAGPIVARALGRPEPTVSLPTLEARAYSACHTRMCLQGWGPGRGGPGGPGGRGPGGPGQGPGGPGQGPGQGPGGPGQGRGGPGGSGGPGGPGQGPGGPGGPGGP